MIIFRNVTVNADSWNNKNAFKTLQYLLEKLFPLLDSYKDDIVLSGKVWLDETDYSVMTRDRVLNEYGFSPRGLSRNKRFFLDLVDFNAIFYILPKLLLLICLAKYRFYKINSTNIGENPILKVIS